jgi:hypothetical protein
LTDLGLIHDDDEWIFVSVRAIRLKGEAGLLHHCGGCLITSLVLKCLRAGVFASMALISLLY